MVNKYHNPGDYVTKFSAHNIPSGIYYIQLVSDKIIINQKTGLTKLLRNDLSKLEKQILTTNTCPNVDCHLIHKF